MDSEEFDYYKKRTGSVKAAVDVYGGSPLVKKSQLDIPEESSSRARELHLARRDISRCKESRRAADSVKAQAESELSIARRTVKDLGSRIEEANHKVKSRKRDVEVLEKSSASEENVLGLGGRSLDSHLYTDVMRELVVVKQELSKLKLDMACLLEEKSQAEKEIEASSLKVWSNLSSAEALKKEIEEVNEEQVLVELARIEALKEYVEIEAEREKEADEFSRTIEAARTKMEGLNVEIDHCKELENKLAVTLYDANWLQNELNNVRNKDKRVQSEAWESSDLLVSITEELEAAKKELVSIKDEGFQFMSSMDVIRNELKHVREETARLMKAEEKSDLTVQNLNSKLLRAKSKLEALTADEEKANRIASNLALTIEQLKAEAEAAKKEKELVTEETDRTKEEIQKTVTEIDSTEEMIQATIQELNAIKSSEALAFENLKSLVVKTMKARASASQNSSSIKISKFEFEYLTGRAVGAEELADKKVAAAHAWIEAFKASEKEMLIKIEMAHKEIREARVEEEKQVFKTERTHSRNWRRKKSEGTAEAENLKPGLARKSMKGSGNATPLRLAKSRSSASPATGMTRSTSFPMKRKTKVIPNFTKLFGAKKTQ